MLLEVHSREVVTSMFTFYQRRELSEFYPERLCIDKYVLVTEPVSTSHLLLLCLARQMCRIQRLSEEGRQTVRRASCLPQTGL